MELYQLQAIRARDLVETHFRGKEYGLQRLQRLCDKGYLERTFTVRENGQRNHSVYSISDKGVDELLKIQKISQERRARDLKLPTMEMLTRIDVSNVVINLEKAGWTFVGGRDAKPLLGLPANSLLQCFLTSPKPAEERYRVYLMGRTIKENTLTKLITELEGNKYGSLILYKADAVLEITPAYKDFVKKVTEERMLVNELCLVPMLEWMDELNGIKRNFALNTMMYGGQMQLERYLKKRYGKVKYGDNRYYFGNTIVEHGGNEYYVCNYLRCDITALRALAENYTIEDYRSMGKGVIVVAWMGHVEEVRETIDNVQERGFIKVEGVTTQDIIDGQAED
jgi:hypothetical protein